MNSTAAMTPKMLVYVACTKVPMIQRDRGGGGRGGREGVVCIMKLFVMVSNARSRGCVGVIIQDNGAQCVIQQMVVM